MLHGVHRLGLRLLLFLFLFGLGRFRHPLLGRLLKALGRGCLLLFLLPALALLLNLPGGDLVHHDGRRLDVIVVLVLVIVISGTIGDGTDEAGNGDLHSAKQCQHRQKHGDDVGQRRTASPAQQIARKAAHNAAGGARRAAGIEIADQLNRLRLHLLGNHQMVNHTAQQGECYGAAAPQPHRQLPTEQVDERHIEQSRNQEIEARPAHKAQHHRPHHHQQCPLGLHADKYKQQKQAEADQRCYQAGRHRILIFCDNFRLLLAISRLFRGLFLRIGLGRRRLPFGVRHDFFRLRRRFFLSHGNPPRPRDSE